MRCEQYLPWLGPARPCSDQRTPRNKGTSPTERSVRARMRPCLLLVAARNRNRSARTSRRGLDPVAVSRPEHNPSRNRGVVCVALRCVPHHHQRHIRNRVGRGRTIETNGLVLGIVFYGTFRCSMVWQASKNRTERNRATATRQTRVEWIVDCSARQQLAEKHTRERCPLAEFLWTVVGYTATGVWCVVSGHG
ncbi:unnamed protein product [Pseudo-nitzschia multistriata]|uniref:Uncharacterized protein n=1 Tax=Pseudo-nitzschia multistriata TaxID=183589 RepID=A0A448ZDY8_9STRA|nr:unnamed protein product [Pseudo-nitzschia multistriata]